MRTIEEIAVDLMEPLDGRFVKKNYNGFDHIEGYVAIDQANRIFGFDGWESEITELRDDLKDGTYHAKVKVTVHFHGSNDTTYSRSKEDVGVCVASQSRDTGKISREARDTAIKGAVTDALKRALRSFGAQFGNSLYERDVTTSNAPQQRQAPRQQQAAPAQRQAAPANGSYNSRREENVAATSYSLEGVPSTPPRCPDCQGEMWDNVASPYWKGGLSQSGKKKPVFSCKDKDGCGKAIWSDTYQNGELPAEWYPEDQQPQSSVDANSLPDQTQVVDLEEKASKIWGDNWEEQLQATATATIGYPEYITAPAADLNKLQELIDRLNPMAA